MAKQFPTTTATATPATADYFAFSDTSDSDEFKKVTLDDLLKTPTDNTFQLGDATHGYKAGYFYNGTIRAKCLPNGSAGFEVGSITNHPVKFMVNDTSIAFVNGLGLHPTTYVGTSLGTNSATTAWLAAYFTNGTAQGAIEYSTNTLRIGSTTGHTVEVMRGDATFLQLGSTEIWSFKNLNSWEDGDNSLGTASYGWSSAFFSDTSVKGRILSQDPFLIGTTSAHNLALQRNSTTQITLSADGLTLWAPASEPADGTLAVNTLTFYLDEASDKLYAKWKESGGTVLGLDLGTGS